MADDKIDQDGNVYQKGWDGQFRPKQGAWGPVKDKNIWDQPNVDHDLFGNPKEARGFFGDSIQSDGGRPLYEPTKRRGGGKPGKAHFYILPLATCLLLGILGGLYYHDPSIFRARGTAFQPPASTQFNFNASRNGPTMPSTAVSASRLAAPGANTPNPTTPAKPSPTLAPSPTQPLPTPKQPPAHTGKLVVLKEAVNLRAGPGVSYSVVGYAYKGDQYQSYGKDPSGKWYQLNSAGDLWIASSAVAPLAAELGPAVTPQALGVAVVIPNSVYLRAGPAKTFGVVGYAYTGDQLPVFGRNADSTWLQLDEAGQAWIAASVVAYEGKIANLPILPTAVGP